MIIGIVCYPTFGGSGVLATELGMALSEKGHEVHFITYQQPVRLHFHPNIIFHEVSVPAYPLFDFAPYETVLTSTMVDVISKYNLDVLHVHYAIPHASSAYFAMQILKKTGKNIPFITTLHGTDITLVGRDPMYKPVVTFSINESSAVTAVSENLKAETYKHFDVKNDIHVIPNFVDTLRFQHSDKSHFKQILAPNGERILTHISNFRKVKRVEDVILMFSELRKKISSKLLMIGDGPERQNAEELSRNLCLGSDVRFLGKQELVDEILNISDLFVLPSEYESFGLAALEAMACGVPVISTNTGGLPEININGVTGYLSNVGDIKDMAENAYKILANDAILNEFKQRSLLHTKQYERDKIVPLYEDLYFNVISNYKNPN